MYDLPDWARYDPVVQQALPQALLPFEDPAKVSGLFAIGQRAYAVRDFETADRVLGLAQDELDRMRRPSPLDRLRGRTPDVPPELAGVQRATAATRACALLGLGRAPEADVWLDRAAALPVAYGDDGGPGLDAARAWSALCQDRPGTAETLLLRLLADPDLPAEVRAVEGARLASARLAQGSTEGVLDGMQAAADALRAAGDLALLASWAPGIVDAHLAQRSLSGARAAIDALESETAAVTGRDGLPVSQAGAQLAVVLAAIGEEDEARARVRRAVESSPFPPAEVLGPPLYRGVQLLVTSRWQRHLSVPRLARVLGGSAWWVDALAVPEHAAVLQGLCESMLDLVSRGSARAVHLQEAAKLALLEGRESDALSLLTAAERLAAAEGDSPVGVRHDVASVHLLAGREDESRAIVVSALDQVPDGSFEQAGLLHELASSSGRAGHHAEAAELYARAATLHVALEHEPDAEDCRRNLRALDAGSAPAGAELFRSGLFEMLWS